MSRTFWMTLIVKFWRFLSLRGRLVHVWSFVKSSMTSRIYDSTWTRNYLKRTDRDYQLSSNILPSKRILENPYVSQCYSSIPHHRPERIISRVCYPQQSPLPYFPSSTYILLTLLLFKKKITLTPKNGITSSLRVKFKHIYHMSQSAVNVTFYTSQRVDPTIGSYKWGAHSEVLITIYVPLYTILISSPFGNDN